MNKEFNFQKDDFQENQDHVAAEIYDAALIYCLNKFTMLQRKYSINKYIKEVLKNNEVLNPNEILDLVIIEFGDRFLVSWKNFLNSKLLETVLINQGKRNYKKYAKQIITRLNQNSRVESESSEPSKDLQKKQQKGTIIELNSSETGQFLEKKEVKKETTKQEEPELNIGQYQQQQQYRNIQQQNQEKSEIQQRLINISNDSNSLERQHDLSSFVEELFNQQSNQFSKQDRIQETDNNAWVLLQQLQIQMIENSKKIATLLAKKNDVYN